MNKNMVKDIKCTLIVGKNVKLTQLHKTDKNTDKPKNKNTDNNDSVTKAWKNGMNTE